MPRVEINRYGQSSSRLPDRPGTGGPPVAGIGFGDGAFDPWDVDPTLLLVDIVALDSDLQRPVNHGDRN
jgi:hypothetical protein